MPTTIINDVNIYYESYGDGFPLILTYVLGGNTGMWAGQIDALSKNYGLILWDPRGHGKSESPPRRDQYGPDISAADLQGLMDHLSIEKAIVGGLSMGGGIAVRFAVAHPERVRAILVIDSASASGLPVKKTTRAMYHKTIELAESGKIEEMADFVIETNPNMKTHGTGSLANRERLRRMLLDLNPMAYAYTLRALLTASFSPEKLLQITVPTLLLAGEADPAFEAINLTHERIPNSKLAVIPDAGHLSNLDQPDWFNAEVLGFLAELDAVEMKPRI